MSVAADGDSDALGLVPLQAVASKARMNRLGPGLRATLVGALTAHCMLAWPSTTWADPARLSIEAPAALRSLLSEHLPLARALAKAQSDASAQNGEPAVLVDEATLAKTRDEASTMLAAEGYFHAKVSTEADGEHGAKLLVDAGPITQVRAVRIRFSGPITAPDYEPLRAKLLSGWPMPQGTPLRSVVWDSAKKVWLEQVRTQVFAQAQWAHTEAVVDEDLPEDGTPPGAELELTLDSGPALRFGDVRISGLERYEPAMIEALRPSGIDAAPFDAAQLTRWQAKLSETGYFGSVSVTPVLDDVRDGRVPIQVQVSEVKRQRLTFALGASSDQGPRLRLGYDHRQAWRWREQPVWLTSALQVEENQRKLEMQLRTPFDGRGYSDGASARLDRTDYGDEVVSRGSIGVHRTRRRDNIDAVWSLNYQFERSLVSNTLEDHRQALTLGYSWNWRQIDNRINPRQGFTLNAQVSGAVKGVLSDASFVRTYVRSLRFIPMPAQSTLVLLGELGAVHARSRDGIPTENLFRAGGTQSVRGYRYQSIGVDSDGAVLGGRYIAVGSVEWQVPIQEPWLLAAFIDAGNAADSVRDVSKLRLGYGVGARVQTPIGPVNLDVAWGERTRQWRLHFSVGYAF